uniref:Uncharacterized protein n=1 Tax=Fagus sylvatica TaxID=28930 RepID=A0A2N9HMZ7_FAGSY
MAVLVQTPVRDRRLAMRDRTPVVHDRDSRRTLEILGVVLGQRHEPMGIATRDGGGFGLPIWWWGLGYGVAGVVVVAVGGQSGRWVLRRRRCLGWGLVDTVVWGLRFGIWVARLRR